MPRTAVSPAGGENHYQLKIGLKVCAASVMKKQHGSALSLQMRRY